MMSFERRYTQENSEAVCINIQGYYDNSKIVSKLKGDREFRK